jgi:hypothetical protein
MRRGLPLNTVPGAACGLAVWLWLGGQAAWSEEKLPAAAPGPVVINEIHYRPALKDEPSEFIEILNGGPAAMDLSGWRFTSGVKCLLPPGTRLEPGGYLVVARSRDFLRRKYGVEAAAEFEGNLSRRGQKLVLQDAAGKVEDEVEYREGFPWPTIADRADHSIELIHPSLDNSRGGSWRLSRGEGAAGGAAAGRPTPLARNSVYSTRSPPQLDQVEYAPERPRSGERIRVTVRAGDPDGVARVSLEYQVVEPGRYIQLSDPEYRTRWVTLPMEPAAGGGPAPGAAAAPAGKSGETLFAAELPADLAKHRTLIRYRITAVDRTGESVTVPYAEDPEPNFACFVYDGVPSWRGAIHASSKDPRRSGLVEYSAAALGNVPVYHLISKRASVEAATWTDQYRGHEFKWSGTLVYEGKVYDHLRYRARGGSWRYAMGKNMWKFAFHRGHEFQAKDDHGRKYRLPWTKLNLGACIQQGEFGHRGEQGMFESVGFRLFNLAGVEAPRTHWVHFRIIDGAEEAPGQYQGDFWGLYLAVEQMDGRFLAQHRLQDGNLYKMESGTGKPANHGAGQPKDGSDLALFLRGYRSGPADGWWRKNLDLPRYYSYRSILECIHHYDIDSEKNYFYFHDPASGRWSVHPWDLDLTWADGMYGAGESPFKRPVLGRSGFALEYRNRLREIRDLLFNTDQAFALIDEHAAVISDPAGKPAMVEADRARWDFCPVLADPRRVLPGKAGTGRFYRAAPSHDFAGMVALMKEYVRSRGSWIDAQLIQDDSVPERPVVTAAGAPPAGPKLRFQVSAYRGQREFAALRWRLGEVSTGRGAVLDPRAVRHYEIEPVWESQELTTQALQVDLPPAAVEPGHTYRIRARMKDVSGRWSHWSEPLEFTA